MVTIVIKSGDIVEFNGNNITLDNKVDDVLIFLTHLTDPYFCLHKTIN